ncbi:hypothetical protein RHGRI_026049 [Rhododendron griersonianum]|uniref:Ubiquitin-like protease family profile domain-containing protein n=1 Tax=Rhododendron griersonianum TaxID=479676 RepID=A0AAV6ISQ9_9ERIC|nr:hypothetical protein RHGRI_026049 [Rhododendron griersonianum]
MIIKNEEYEGNNERVADLFFKNKGYTGPIDACEEIYIPFNHNKDHWLYLKIDMVQHAAYLFNSKPSRRFGEDRKKMGELLLENMHEVLKHAYESDYVQDVSLFKVDWLSEQPLQFDEDNYDCGLFVIKYMQDSRMKAILQGDKASMTGIVAKKCVPIRKRVAGHHKATAVGIKQQQQQQSIGEAGNEFAAATATENSIQQNCILSETGAVKQ